MSPKMASTKVPITISYNKPGTQPPVYVAGSYSEPQWQPEEMEAAADEQGNYIFKKEFHVKPGCISQYKFRLGPGDWWVLDEETDTGMACSRTERTKRLSYHSYRRCRKPQ